MPDGTETLPVEGSAIGRRSTAHGILLAWALAGGIALVALALFVEPDPRGYGTHEGLGLPPCLSIPVLGLPCPACGVTTALTLAARGRLLDSLLTQPLGFALAIGLATFAAWAPLAHALGRDLARDLGALTRRGASLASWLLGLGLVAWIYKMATLCL